jgi:hypothetical protein
LIASLQILSPRVTGKSHGASAGQPAGLSRESHGVRRFHTRDPFGNRVEFQQA